jgi:hypothetical protein
MISATFATGRREIPDWTDDQSVDPQLGAALPAGSESA